MTGVALTTATRILITGGAGYLGTYLARELLECGVPVTILDRFDWGVAPLTHLLCPNLTLLRGDVRNTDAVARAIEGCDAVVHLAGIVGYPACDRAPTDAVTTHVVGTEVVANLAAGRRVVLASTTSVYGTQSGAVTEASTPAPTTIYGQSKWEAERLLDANGVVLRFATLYGPSARMRWDQLPHDFVRTAVREEVLTVYQPEAPRPFLHVIDAAQAIRWALEKAPGGAVKNIIGETLTKRELAQKVQTLTGCEIRLGPGEDPEHRTYPVTSTLPWHGCYDLDHALPLLVALAHLEHP